MNTQTETPRSVNFESIPQALKDPPQWVLWREEKRDGRLTKVPYQPGGSLASSTNPSTWSDFETVRAAFESGGFAGIGFVFAEDGPFVGVDLDDCFDGGALTDGALDVVERLDSYTETSPSGTGLHVICEGFIPHERNRTGGVDGMKELEIYEDGRYFTFTGEHFGGTPNAPKQRAQELYSLCKDLFGAAEKNRGGGAGARPTPAVDRSDAELLELIRSSEQGDKFERLWTGDIAGYSSHSEADQALCSILSFWTQRDRERVDTLFRKSNLYRKKWERDSYRKPTLDTAMDVDEVHQGRNRVTAKGQGDGKGDGIQKNAVTQNSGRNGAEGRKSPQGDGIDGILSNSEPEGGDNRKQADKIRDLATDVELFETPEGKVYAAFEVDGHRETWPADSDRFEMHLMRLFLQAEGKTPDAQALKDARRVLKSDALFETETTEVHTRVGRGEDGALYIDLCDEEWRAVRVTGDGWEIVDRPPVHFRRSRSMEPLPVPDEDGDIEALRPFVNTATDKDWRLVVAWLVAALRPEGPYPALVLQGEQGSAKSTLARFLRTLVDPSAAPLRSPSRNQRDLMITATNSHVIAFDNVSGLKTWLSDALCSLATGGGFATRELHTDTEEIIFNAMRPAVLTGIEDVATRDDLAERSLVLTLSAIRESERMSERALNEKFEAAAPVILGGVLDALSVAERRVEHVQLENPPRMADFAEWLVAAEPALPWEEGGFMEAYDVNRTTAVLDNIQMNPLASGIRELMESADRDTWQGTPSELKDRLDSIVPESDQSAKVYPGSPSWVTRRLNRVKKMLREAGIEVETPRVQGKRMIRITGGAHKSRENAVNAVTQPEKSASDGDEGRNQGDGKKSDAVTHAVTQPSEGDGKTGRNAQGEDLSRGDPVETPDGTGTVKELRPGDPPKVLVSLDHGPPKRYSRDSLTRQDEAPF